MRLKSFAISIALTLFLLACNAQKNGELQQTESTGFDIRSSNPLGEILIRQLIDHERFPPVRWTFPELQEAKHRFGENPELEENALDLCGAYFLAGEYETALPLLEREFENQDYLAIARLFSGSIKLKQGDYESGVRDIQIMVDHETNPAYKSLYLFAVSSIYNELFMHEEAISNLLILVEMKPDDAQNFLDLGWNYGGVGEFDKAREHINHATQFTPADDLNGVLLHKTAHFYLGMIEWNAGNTDLALEHLENSTAIGGPAKNVERIRASILNGDSPTYLRHLTDTLF